MVCTCAQHKFYDTKIHEKMKVESLFFFSYQRENGERKKKKQRTKIQSYFRFVDSPLRIFEKRIKTTVKIQSCVSRYHRELFNLVSSRTKESCHLKKTIHITGWFFVGVAKRFYYRELFENRNQEREKRKQNFPPTTKSLKSKARHTRCATMTL